MEPRDIVATAVLGTVAAITAGWLARKIGKWLLAAIGNSLAETIRALMKSDLDGVHHSINAMGDANTRDHSAVQARLVKLEQRQTDVESRLAAVETRLSIRPSDAHTRSTDKE